MTLEQINERIEEMKSEHQAFVSEWEWLHQYRIKLESFEALKNKLTNVGADALIISRLEEDVHNSSNEIKPGKKERKERDSDAI